MESSTEVTVITLSDFDEAEQELQAELDLAGDGDLLPEHTTKVESDTKCARCTLVAAKAIEIARSREALPN